MLVSAVVDPSAFNRDYFDELYKIQAEDLLKGIQRNGLLIVDSENRLRDAIIQKVKSIPIKYRQQLQLLMEELLLKKISRRVIPCFVHVNYAPSTDLLDLAYHLRALTKADALIVGNENLERLKAEGRSDQSVVPLFEYRDSSFEKERQKCADPTGAIDALSKEEVENYLIGSTRFTKWLRFYDPYIGRGHNTEDFLKGIRYILSLWNEHGFFADQEGVGSVEIFTCRDSKRDVERQRQKIIQEFTIPLQNYFPWPVKVQIKADEDRIFHARYLETQHAIIAFERGFDIFKRDGAFQRNFFTLNLAAGSHLKECRDLPDA